MLGSNFLDFQIIQERISFNDSDLITKFYESHNNFLEKKKILDMRLGHLNENDYLSTAIAKLQYGFAKEEHDILLNEIVKRGLITN